MQHLGESDTRGNSGGAALKSWKPETQAYWGETLGCRGAANLQRDAPNLPTSIVSAKID